jgi:hypothetical protein
MPSRSKSRRSRLGILCALGAALLVNLSGCDTIDPGPEPVVIEAEQSFRFETTREQLQGGTTIASSDRLDVSQRLIDFGFTTGDLLGAEIIEVTLERVQPVGVSLNAILSSATVRTSAGSLPEVTLASSSTMSAAASQQLTPGSVSNLAAYLRQGSAPVRLAVQPGPSLADQNYVLRVRVRLRLTLEGV